MVAFNRFDTKSITIATRALIEQRGNSTPPTTSGLSPELAPLVGTLLGLPLGELIHFDGKRAITAATGFAFAYGVNVSLDGKNIYVAEAIGRKLVVFDRDQTSGKLSSRVDYDIETAADNIDVAPDGSLYIGAYPDLLAFSTHSSEPQVISPS